MADGVFNIAKGRVIELIARVRSNDPSTAVLVIVVLKATGLEADDTLNNYDDLAALLAASNDEATNTGYGARKTLSDTDLASYAPVVDDTNNRVDADIPDQTWTAVQTTGGAWGKFLVCYWPAGGADSTVIPLTYHDFAVTPDGSDIVAQIAAAGFYRAA